MKKYVVSFIIFLILLGVILFSVFRKKEDNGLTKVTVAEVAHSVFYAPQYAAISNGYFIDEGIDIELVLANGADSVMAAVLSGDVQIGFSGTEATIYVYQAGEKDYVKTFAGLTQRDGSFIVSREKIENFTLEDLKGKYVIGGRKGGMPEMTFEWALREHNIDPKGDLTIDTSIAFAAMQGAFIGGTGDFVTLFEPNATNVEKQGLGYVVAYVGELGGEVPYTAYNAKSSYIEQNPEIIEGFTKAVNRGLEFVYNNSSEVIAKSIINFFPDTSINDLVTIVTRYKEAHAWKENITINKQEWQHIQDIIVASGELHKIFNYFLTIFCKITLSIIRYEDLIYTKYFKDYE